MDTVTQTRRTAELYLAAANAHDVEGMVALWAPGGVETFPTFAQSLRVPDEFASHVRSLFDAIPDVQWDIVSITANADTRLCVPR